MIEIFKFIYQIALVLVLGAFVLAGSFGGPCLLSMIAMNYLDPSMPKVLLTYFGIWFGLAGMVWMFKI